MPRRISRVPPRSEKVGAIWLVYDKASSSSTGALREEKELWEAMCAARAAANDFQRAYEATQRVSALDDRLRRERAMLQAVTTVERRAAERAQREAEIARATR